MNQIIPIGKHEFSGCLKPTVNARELHGFLGVSTKFATWINRRIDEYGFANGVDFVRMELPAGYAAAQTGGGLDEILSAQKWEAQETSTYDFGQQGRIEYYLTLDMAKELSMVERTDKGKQARQYFIECERRAQSPAIPQTLPEALRLAADLAEQNQRQAARLQVTEPKAAAFDRIGAAQDSKTVTEVARIVKMPRDKLFALLQRKGWLFRQNGVWQGYADAVARGLVTHGVHNIARSHGTENRTQVYITAKGIAKVAALLAKEGAAV